MLDYEVVEARAAAGEPRVLVLLHGRGADADDMLSLAQSVRPDLVVVAPHAPHPAAEWGYGPGRAWYRYIAEDRPDAGSFMASQAALGALLDALPAELDVAPHRIGLGGFSQGGTMSLGHALLHPQRPHPVLVFSGFLPDVPAMEGADRPGGPVFWGHGTHDPAIPHALAVRGRDRLREAGAELEARDYRIGHWIAPDELEDAMVWLERAIPPGDNA